MLSLTDPLGLKAVDYVYAASKVKTRGRKSRHERQKLQQLLSKRQRQEHQSSRGIQPPDFLVQVLKYWQHESCRKLNPDDHCPSERILLRLFLKLADRREECTLDSDMVAEVIEIVLEYELVNPGLRYMIDILKLCADRNLLDVTLCATILNAWCFGQPLDKAVIALLKRTNCVNITERGGTTPLMVASRWGKKCCENTVYDRCRCQR